MKELSQLQFEVLQIWRERNESTNIIDAVHCKRVSLFWHDVTSVAEYGYDDDEWKHLNGKTKISLFIKSMNDPVTIIGDYETIRDKWVEKTYFIGCVVN